MKRNFCKGCQKEISYKTKWCDENCKKIAVRLNTSYRNFRFAPTELKEFILKRDQYKCQYCGREVRNETANIDHVKPWPKGKTTLRNLVTSCRRCNKNKSNFIGLKLRKRNGKIFIGRDKKYQIYNISKESIIAAKISSKRTKRTYYKKIQEKDETQKSLS